MREDQLFKEDKYYLVYLEKRLEVRPRSISLEEYDIDVLLNVWTTHIRAEECRYLSDAFELVQEVVKAEDYDYRVKFIGIFKGNEQIYWPDDILREIQTVQADN